MSNIEDAIVRGSELKSQIDTLKNELAGINLFLAKEAAYKPGSKTGHIEAHGIVVTVSERMNITYDQERLAYVREHFDFFHEAFRPEWKPVNKNIEIFSKDNDEFRKAVEWSRTITPGAPTVKYEKIQE